MNRLQQLMYNAGERLVPYVSHDELELIRHRSSYAFFHAVISSDLKTQPLERAVTVSDLGFGSGYGCAILSSLPNSRITGVDIGDECETFAKQYYARANVEYLLKDLTRYVPEAAPLDYVVSRGVLEHVPGGLDLIRSITFNRRAMIDVPYDEAPGNHHHVLTHIKEDTFASFDNCEFFYEDLNGKIYDAANKPPKPNMIMVVLSAPGMPKVGSLLTFPLEPVKDTALEIASGITAQGCRHYYDSALALLTGVEKVIRETEVVMDIGCGIAPMNYFRPKLHMMVEPWKEYADILTYRYRGDKSALVLRCGGLEAMELLADNSVDSVFLLDVIEHLEKEEGQKFIAQSERIAREQIVIFTPLGFMPQHVEHGEKDGWGLNGNAVQEHRSGWEPEDFSKEWSFHICQNFHNQDFKGAPLETVYGAFFAVRNFEHKSVSAPHVMADYRKLLPSEVELQRVEIELDLIKGEYERLLKSKGMLVIRIVKRVLRILRLR